MYIIYKTLISYTDVGNITEIKYKLKKNYFKYYKIFHYMNNIFTVKCTVHPIYNIGYIIVYNNNIKHNN